MVKVLWNARDWTEAIAALPVSQPLPCRTVLVDRERIAHVLRRELIRAGRADVLAGTRFVRVSDAAVQTLRAARVAFEPGENTLRRARLIAVFRSVSVLEHFPRELLRDRPGWDEAFAHTISDLEGAGLQPDDLRTQGAPARLRDVATIWHALDESAGRSWTTQRIYTEAGRALERHPDLWPFPGSVLAYAAGDVTGAEARFIRAIPRTTLALLAARPARERYLRRMEALLGGNAGDALESARAPRADRTERDILASFLFESPSVLAEASRPRSDGPDETVALEEHAGAEAEIEATADWVARQISSGIPLEEIAVLVPTLDPVAGLVAERLARLPWHAGILPVHVAGGLPLAGTPGGARVLAVVRALQAHLSAESVAAVLPALRPAAPDGRHLTYGAAMDLAWSLGTVGGNPAWPAGALEWSARANAREAELAAELERARAAEASGGVSARRARDIERLLEDLRAVRPALDALVAVARHVVGGAPLAVLWPALREFLEAWLLEPGEGPRGHALLDEPLGLLASDLACGGLAGVDALGVIEETVRMSRLTSGRFGEPAVYVGTVRDAVGLSFRAVRVIGLCEGHLPSVPREDPVVPDVVRETLVRPDAEPVRAPPPTAADRALEDLHALDAVVRNAVERIALSAPRLDLQRSQREPSSVILEAAAALGRPNRATRERGPVIPDMTGLRRDGFTPAREAAERFRRERPIAEAAWHDAVSMGAIGVPSRWRGIRSLDLERAAQSGPWQAFGPLDGLLGPSAGTLAVPGLSAERAISPSALETLLGCPYAFLLGYVLGFDEPASPPPLREIGQPYYGNLVHAVVAEFYGRHGASFCAREGTLDEWLGRADEHVQHSFGEFLRQYPLVGDAVRAQQRDRLRRDVHEFLEHDWATAPASRRFVAVERPFGPVELVSGGASLFVRGRIDRIDADGSQTRIRDLKTGRPHPRTGNEVGPDPALDLQIGAYGLVVGALADEWQIPKRVSAAYTYVGRGSATERSYAEDFHEVLEPATRGWLGLARTLLAGRLFPRTPQDEDCTFCRFRPVCGDGFQERAAALLVATPELGDFAKLKGTAPSGAGED